MANKSIEAEIAKLAAHAESEKYSKAFRYREADRPSHSIDNISTAQLGHMLDTLNDALIIMRRLADKPQIDVHKDPAYEPLESEKPVPSYLTRIATDPRSASSYARTDLERLQEVKKDPDLADLSNRIHGLLRLQAHEIGQTFIMPEHIKPLVEQYEAVIVRYTALLDANKNPQTGKRDYTKIPAKEMAAYAIDYAKAANELFPVLRKLNPEVKIGGEPYRLPGDKPVNDRLEDSFPALVLFGASIFSKGVADRNKRPGKLEFEGTFRTILGAESLLTDTAQFLCDLAKTAEKPFTFPDYNRKTVKKMLPTYERSLQQVLAFCRTADCGYDKLYQDLEQFITLANPTAKPELGEFLDTKEIALMLYAVDRRFAREEKEPVLQMKLRAFADQISQYKNIEDLNGQLGRDIDFQRLLTQTRQIAEANAMEHVIPVVDKLEKLLQPLQGAAVQLEAQRHALSNTSRHSI